VLRYHISIRQVASLQQQEGTMTIHTRSILTVLAHPDDEAFTMGGTLARYAQEGTPVVLCTLTRGENSRHRITHGITDAEMAAIRSSEVQEAVRILGITEHLQYDFPDGGLRDVDPRMLEALISELVERFHPSLLLGFDVQGGSGHPDHITLHHVLKRVFYSMRESHGFPLRFACTVLPELRVRHWPRKVFGVREERIDAVIDVSRWRDVEENALRAHASVAGDVEEHNYDNWMLWPEEYFTFCGDHRDSPCRDLFEGLDLLS
jgi:N-acetyl-1-D-myo-inositol-2-amino-2-deoxy-alpha-D-glucopyranoside deacetylase